MANGSGEFPIGKAVAFFVVVALTFMPVMKCGPIDFVGHEILRNELPDVEDVTGGLSKSLGDLNKSMGGSGDVKVNPGRDVRHTRDRLFPSGETWMWLLYIAIFAAAVLSFFAASQLRAVLGVFGVGALLLFLGRFEDALGGVGKPGSSKVDMDLLEWGAGAYVAVIGFAVLVIDGLRSTGPPKGRRVID